MGSYEVLAYSVSLLTDNKEMTEVQYIPEGSHAVVFGETYHRGTVTLVILNGWLGAGTSPS